MQTAPVLDSPEQLLDRMRALFARLRDARRDLTAYARLTNEIFNLAVAYRERSETKVPAYSADRAARGPAADAEAESVRAASRTHRMR